MRQGGWKRSAKEVFTTGKFSIVPIRPCESGRIPVPGAFGLVALAVPEE